MKMLRGVETKRCKIRLTGASASLPVMVASWRWVSEISCRIRTILCKFFSAVRLQVTVLYYLLR